MDLDLSGNGSSETTYDEGDRNLMPQVLSNSIRVCVYKVLGIQQHTHIVMLSYTQWRGNLGGQSGQLPTQL